MCFYSQLEKKIKYKNSASCIFNTFWRKSLLNFLFYMILFYLIRYSVDFYTIKTLQRRLIE